jgi:hypothetical protein
VSEGGIALAHRAPVFLNVCTTISILQRDKRDV